MTMRYKIDVHFTYFTLHHHHHHHHYHYQNYYVLSTGHTFTACSMCICLGYSRRRTMIQL